MLCLLVAPIVLNLRAIVQGRLSRLSPLFESLSFVHLFPDLRFLRTLVRCVRRRLQRDFFPRFPGRCFFPPPAASSLQRTWKRESFFSLGGGTTASASSSSSSADERRCFLISPFECVTQLPCLSGRQCRLRSTFPLIYGGEGAKGGVRYACIGHIFSLGDGRWDRY